MGFYLMIYVIENLRFLVTLKFLQEIEAYLQKMSSDKSRSCWALECRITMTRHYAKVCLSLSQKLKLN